MMSVRKYHSLSKLFRPVLKIPKGANMKKKDISLRQKLLEDMGFISRREPGMYAILPLGMRVLNKILAIVDEEMLSLNAQKVSLPFLTDVALWEKTGRHEGSELFKVMDRVKRTYILGPTHEESMTDLVCNTNEISTQIFPLRIYQINNKFRDEMRPQYGLIRSRDFLMKDLYTFDLTAEKALDTYHLVSEAYSRIFNKIGVPFMKVKGDVGEIGGSLSHEYHYPARIGDDTLLSCEDCNININEALATSSMCSNCNKKMHKTKGIEVGHTFLLGTKYTEAICDHTRISSSPLQMGCYGIGITRLMAASVEVLSSEKVLKWRQSIAPFQICVVSSSLSKHAGEKTPSEMLPQIMELIMDSNIKDDFIVDDRYDLTLGNRVVDAKKCGYPVIIVLGKKCLQEPPVFEVIDMENQTKFLEISELQKYIQTIGKNV